MGRGLETETKMVQQNQEIMNLLQGGWKERGRWTLGMNQTIHTGMCWRILLASMGAELWDNTASKSAVPNPSAQLWTQFRLSLWDERGRCVHFFVFLQERRCRLRSGRAERCCSLQSGTCSIRNETWLKGGVCKWKPRRFAKGKVVQLKEPLVAPNLIFKVLLRRHVFIFTW